MVVVRDIFRLKFGQAKEATALWKEAVTQLRSSGYGSKDIRLLTDLAGPPFYSLIMESSYDSLAQWEQAHQKVRTNAAWRSLYEKMIPLIENGHREFFGLVQ